MQIRGKKIAVLGLTDSGVNLIRATAKGGAQVSGYGTAGAERDRAIQEEMKGLPVKFHHDPLPEAGLADFDLIVHAPGGWLYKAAYEWAKIHGIPVYSDLDFACQFIKAPMIGITGTAGKSTTAALLTSMLQKQGYRVLLLGGEKANWADPILDKKTYDYIVLEVSSHRLEASDSFHPHIAVLLNIFPAHGERHAGGLPAYLEAKARIFAHQGPEDFLVFNANAGNIRELIRLKSPPVQRLMFDSESPVAPPGSYAEKKNLHWVGAEGQKETFVLKSTRNWKPPLLLDLLAAIAVAKLCQTEAAAIQSVIDAFKPLPGRMERVRKVSGVIFFNDSRASNIGATAWALASFSRPIIWIAGGAPNQGAQLQELQALTGRGNVKSVVVFGSQAKTFAKAFQDIAPVRETKSLKEAVELAYHLAKEKDVVLFSPASPPDLGSTGPWGKLDQEYKNVVKSLPKKPKEMQIRAHFTRI